MKDKAYRRAQDKRIIKKRLTLVKNSRILLKDKNGKTQVDYLTEAPNKLSKKHPFDCGKKDCLLCHSEKVFKRKKPRDIRKEIPKGYLEDDFND